MRKIFLGSIALAALIAAPAMAADLGVRPVYKSPVPVAVWSWTGLYVGLNTGGSIGQSSTTDSGVYVGGPASGLGTNTLYGESFRRMPTGWIFGGQVGYNWQVSSFVIGFEADWQWSGQKDTANVFGCGAPATAGFFSAGGQQFSQCLSDESKLRNFGTARARGGVVVNDSLWYVTGGAAWATVNENLALSSNFNPAAGGGIFSSPFVAGTNLAAFSHTKSGWTIGGGVETRLWGGWSAKLEYLYVDLGSVTDAFVIAGNPAFNTAIGAGATTAGAGNTFTVTSSTHIRDHIVRVGLNYKIY